MGLDLKGLSDQALVEKISTTERDLVTARFDHAQQQLEDTSTLSRIRKDIARMKTEVRARELAQGLRKGQLEVQFSSSARGVAPVSAERTAADRGGFLKGIVDRLTAKE